MGGRILTKKHPKLTLMMLLPLLLSVVFLKLYVNDAPEDTLPSSETSIDAVRTSLVSAEQRTAVTTDGYLSFTTAEKTHLMSTETRTDTPLTVLSPTVEFLPLVTGLPDTPPRALETLPRPFAPVLVTGLPDTPPISLPEIAPVASDATVAAFVATVHRLDFPKSESLGKTALQKELDAMVEKAKEAGVNTLYFQVRPASDAFYASDLFPASRYLTKEEGGKMPLDVLSYLVKAAHRKGIRVHAWINPYRVTAVGEALSSLSPDNPAHQLSSDLLYVGGGYTYDPASERVKELIVKGVAEIVSRYEVDGILFDDYFYPAGITDEDLDSFLTYQRSGGDLSLGDFRREQVNELVRRCFFAIKEIDHDCLFGISPRGIWRNRKDDPRGSDTTGAASYDEVYADALTWVEGGYLDYIAPQLYWSFNESAAPFRTLADWWQTALSGSKVSLTFALAPYRLGKEELSAEIFYLSSLPNTDGYALFRFSYLGSAG